MEIRNFVMLVGNMGADPKVNETRGGKVARFSLATSESYFENGKPASRTEWHNIVAWGANADKVSERCSKGMHITIVGRLTSRSYEDANNVKRYITEVVANEVICESSLKEKTE
jgi:single-strand DNA-binding protein